MNPSETEPTTQNVMSSSEPETFPLTKDQLLFAESIYACLPMSIEIYDTNGILRSINEHALQSLIKRLWLISSIFLIVLIWTKLSKIAFREAKILFWNSNTTLTG